MLLLDDNDDFSVDVTPNDEQGGGLSKEKLNFDRAIESVQRENVKIQINTLSPYVGFGGGSYQMSDVKRMTAKEDFLKMPLKDRNCEVELYEDCRTRKLLEECNCVPWEPQGLQVLSYKSNFLLIDLLIQDMVICDAKGRDCIEKNSPKTFHCNTTCVGIYADVQWVGRNIEELKNEKPDGALNTGLAGEIDDDLMKILLLLRKEFKSGDKEVMKIATGQSGDEVDRKKYKMLISEYKKFKTKNVKHFRFNSAANMSTYGEYLLSQYLRKKNICYRRRDSVNPPIGGDLL